MSRLPRILYWYLVPVVVLGLVNLACCTAAVWLGYGVPYTNILVPRFMADFQYMARLVPLVHTYGFFALDVRSGFRYPAPVMALYLAFYLLPHHAFTFRWFLRMVVGLPALLITRALVARGVHRVAAALFVVTAILFCYPMWFEYRQANTEIYLFAMLALGVWAHVTKRPVLEGICFGCAGAAKLYPFVFFGLAIAQRRYRTVLVGAVVAAVVTVASLALLTPSIAYSWHGVTRGLADYRAEAFEHFLPYDSGYDHSVFAMLKRLQLFLVGDLRHIKAVLNTYMLLAAVAGTALFVTRLRKLPLPNQVVCLTCAAVFLPPSSFDYTLMHFLIPLTLVVLAAVEAGEAYVRGLRGILICLALINAPEMEFFHHGTSFNGVIKALASLLLFYLAARYPLALREVGEGDAGARETALAPA